MNSNYSIVSPPKLNIERVKFETEQNQDSKTLEVDETRSLPTLASALHSASRTLTSKLPKIFEGSLKSVDKYMVPLLERFESRISEERKHSALRNLEELTQIPSIYFVIGGSAAAYLVLRWVFKITTVLLVDIMTILYPALKSIQLLEYKSMSPEMKDMNVEKTEERHWLTYWVLFATLKFSDGIKPFVYLYKSLRTVILVWALHPRSRGATTIYRKVLRPLLKKKKQFALLYSLIPFFEALTPKMASDDSDTESVVMTEPTLLQLNQSRKSSMQSEAFESVMEASWSCSRKFGTCRTPSPIKNPASATTPILHHIATAAMPNPGQFNKSRSPSPIRSIFSSRSTNAPLTAVELCHEQTD